MDTEMTCYASFAEVTEDFYCSAVDVLKILVLRLHDYHARCFHSLRDALYDYFSTDAAPHTHANVSTKHKNALDIEKFLNRKEKIHPDDTFIMVDADSLPPA